MVKYTPNELTRNTLYSLAEIHYIHRAFEPPFKNNVKGFNPKYKKYRFNQLIYYFGIDI